ncbi:hypothetical protein Lfu02_69270 [Longispora fulva]|nr:hypothetical protein Lfu02_69270 [Longispora fulva]
MTVDGVVVLLIAHILPCGYDTFGALRGTPEAEARSLTVPALAAVTRRILAHDPGLWPDA